MGLTISVNNNTESREKYKILDNEEPITEPSTELITEPITEPLAESMAESIKMVNDSENTDNFRCPNQHLNCKNQRCWW